MKKTALFALFALALMLVAGPTFPSQAHSGVDLTLETPEADAGQSAGALLSPDNLWETVDSKTLEGYPSDFKVKTGYFGVYHLNDAAMKAQLGRAPVEFTEAGKAPDVRITLPMPDGTFQSFRVWESSIMEAPLAAEYPEIKTYMAQGIDDPTATVRLDTTPLGFHAQVLSTGRTVYIDPYKGGDTARYISYDKKGLRNNGKRFQCLVEDTVDALGDDVEKGATGPVAVYTNGGTLRTYRLAEACTGEYATAICNHNGVAVTVANTMSAVTTTINRVTGIYEREVSIRMVLIANNSSIIYTNASTDPYTNTNANSLLTQNQSTCDSVIGSGNYDIGHVFSTGGGGLAGLGVVCSSTRKAQGETGSSSPWGDGFDVDYVAHEMGHQFGGNHTFVGTQGSCSGNGNASTAYERGSGSTIMAYAGICGTDDLQPHSDDYFHSISLNEITNYMTGGGACSVNTSSGNTTPTLTIGSNYTGVPVGTPFTLTAQSASDANGDTLTYCWEDWQTGSACKYRPRPPTTSPSRTIPQMSDVLAGSNSTAWETTATQATGSARTFRCTVRDNRAGGGGYTSATMTVTFVAGAFSVSAPNTAVSWAGNTSQTVSWTKGGSTAANVKISLSTNGGTTWTTLVASTANDGSEAVTVPNTPSTQCRIRVEPTDNIYFDVSDVNFTITSGGGGTPPAAPSGLTATAVSSSAINLAWTDNASDETGFKIERKTGVGGTYAQIGTAGANATTFPDSGLAASTTYYYRVRANNAFGDSGYSNEANATTQTGGGGGDTPISCGASLNGTLSSGDVFSTVRTTSKADFYTFSGTAGATATITMVKTGASTLDTWLVLKDPSGTVVAQDDDGNGSTNSLINNVTLLATGTYRIEATSYYASTNANGLGDYTITLTCGSGPVTLLNEGAESGASGWTTSTNVTGNNWVLAANGRRTGANGFRTANDTTYVNNLDQSLISPAFSLTGKTSATLTYYFKHSTESGYDFFRVEVSTNGGTSWTSLSSTSGASSGFSQTAGSGFAPQKTISLTPYVGNANVKIRFRLTSDVSITGWGAAVDDIVVTAQ